MKEKESSIFYKKNRQTAFISKHHNGRIVKRLTTLLSIVGRTENSYSHFQLLSVKRDGHHKSIEKPKVLYFRTSSVEDSKKISIIAKYY